MFCHERKSKDLHFIIDIYLCNYFKNFTIFQMLVTAFAFSNLARVNYQTCLKKQKKKTYRIKLEKMEKTCTTEREDEKMNLRLIRVLSNDYVRDKKADFV